MIYLNNYDSEKFSKVFEHLYFHDNSILFEIELTYKSYFKEWKIFGRIWDFEAYITIKELTESVLLYIKNLNLF